jgi:hypothetical protein
LGKLITGFTGLGSLFTILPRTKGYYLAHYKILYPDPLDCTFSYSTLPVRFRSILRPVGILNARTLLVFFTISKLFWLGIHPFEKSRLSIGVHLSPAYSMGMTMPKAGATIIASRWDFSTLRLII